MKFLHQKKGLTLIELIISIAILAIILTPFLSGLGNGYASIFSQGRKTKAISQAQAIIDYIYANGTINETELATTFDINAKVDYSNLTTSAYNPLKPIYYSVKDMIVGTPPAAITTKEVSVLVFYENGRRYIILSALVP